MDPLWDLLQVVRLDGAFFCAVEAGRSGKSIGRRERMTAQRR
jgi:hypothetical protein